MVDMFETQVSLGLTSHIRTKNMQALVSFLNRKVSSISQGFLGSHSPHPTLAHWSTESAFRRVADWEFIRHQQQEWWPVGF